MDLSLLHPKIVHLPIALAVLMPLIAGGLALSWWRGWLPRRTWWVAVLLQGVLVGSAFVAMETGEDDEERVEKVVPEAAIEAHEEAAEGFAWTSVGVLALFGLALFLGRRPVALSLAALAVVGTLVVLGLGYRVGEAGGALVYEHGAADAYTKPGAVAPSTGADGARREHHEDEDDDDD